MARSVFFLLVFIGLASAAIIEDFELFKTLFSKKYNGHEEETYRRQVFEHNLRFVRKHNAMNLSFTVAMNEFGDLTGEEFAKKFLSSFSSGPKHNGSTFLSPSNVQLPQMVDWRKEGYVTGIKNQGECGSCWSFSTTGSVEGQYFKKTGKLVSLSEQQLVSCSSNYGNLGCQGGLMDNAFEYIEHFGIEPETDYPYKSFSGSVPSCEYNKKLVAATVTGFVDIPTGDEGKLTAALATVGPISVAIDASQRSFQLYKSGVYVEPDCSSQTLDHGVLAVGYGTLSDQDYYIVKNSWGAQWGMSGYILMARNRQNQCGIATEASYPLV